MIPRFSIIVPLYNKAPFVRKALESIVSQTYQDWECIVVDDGSMDNSFALAQQCVNTLPDGAKRERFRLLQQPNAGVAAARNTGVAASRGEYICFLDADDWWEATFLEEMIRLIADYPEAGIYASNYIYYKPGKTHVALNLPRGYIDYPKAYYEGAAMPVWTGATCMPRKVFDEVGGFPVGIRLGEDFLLWAKTAIRYPIAFSDKPLSFYNNDVPASLRATRNLHAPKYHMLFNLTSLEREMEQSAIRSEQSAVWKQLLDKLRIAGLMDYWLSDKYHDRAAAELRKVDWNNQPQKAKLLYNKPIWLLRAQRRVMQIGSYCKQRIIKLTKPAEFQQA